MWLSTKQDMLRYRESNSIANLRVLRR